ncbi:unnamed protein product [Dibothriocephalus latus]|uniref:Dynein heavy chain AAA lid domain-containing protein n=1 Tax=Dibothriocephalus latus TaxID=60516 RepID=A0A3P7R7D4_DIBLA|nr:unnamed protein product [Dibothriocephalus latus]
MFAPSASSSAVSSGIWKSIKGLLNNAIYGGRMDNPFDVKVLETFLDQIFNETTIRTRQLGSFTLPGTTNVRAKKVNPNGSDLPGPVP